MITVNRKLLHSVLKSELSKNTLFNQHLSCITSLRINERNRNNIENHSSCKSNIPGTLSNSDNQIFVRCLHKASRKFQTIKVKKPLAQAFVDNAPQQIQPYLRLMRVDRPIGKYKIDLKIITLEYFMYEYFFFQDPGFYFGLVDGA